MLYIELYLSLCKIIKCPGDVRVYLPLGDVSCQVWSDGLTAAHLWSDHQRGTLLPWDEQSYKWCRAARIQIRFTFSIFLPFSLPAADTFNNTTLWKLHPDSLIILLVRQMAASLVTSVAKQRKYSYQYSYNLLLSLKRYIISCIFVNMFLCQTQKRTNQRKKNSKVHQFNTDSSCSNCTSTATFILKW